MTSERRNVVRPTSDRRWTDREVTDRQATDRRVWFGLVDTLSGMPDVITSLLAQHADDGSGSCAVCRVPGRSTPRENYPCRLYALASAARNHATRTAPDQG